MSVPALSRLLPVAFAFFAGAASLHAATFMVDTTTDSIDAEPGNGVCADADGQCSLRAAIQEANALIGADMIVLPKGTYTLTLAGIDEDASATGDLDITDDTSIVGDGADATIVDANALDRIFDLFPADDTRKIEVSMSQLTARNGQISGGGEAGASVGVGFRIAASVHLVLDDVSVRGNRSTGMYQGLAFDSTGCIDGNRVRILDNRDTGPDGSMSARATVYLHGDAGNSEGACFSLTDSEISGNRADWAGAIFSDFVPITLRRSLVSENESRLFGAMTLDIQADTLLENVTISGNRSLSGAIMLDAGSHLTLVHSTVTANVGSCCGGGLTNFGGFTVLANSIVAGNIADSSPDCYGFTSLGGNIIGNTSGCPHTNDPSDQYDVDPGLQALADNGGLTRTHLPGARAIDRALSEMCKKTDQRGYPRPVDGDDDGNARCDVGAVEVGAEPPLPKDDAIFTDGFESSTGKPERPTPMPAV